MRLSGKVALISGAARGMGATEARLFAKEGAKVVLGDILEAEGRSVEAEIRASGGDAVFVRLDVTSESDWQNSVATAISKFGKLNVLVNNAGIDAPQITRVEDTSLDAWNKVIQVNATGVFLGTKTALPVMRKAGGGSIINISSQMGIVGAKEPPTAQYVASKGAVRLFTKAAALQYAKEGIRVNSVHPGSILTPMNAARRADPEYVKSRVAQIPLGRYGTAEEVAYGVLYLASDESSYVTGAELVIDGGWIAQ